MKDHTDIVNRARNRANALAGTTSLSEQLWELARAVENQSAKLADQEAKIAELERRRESQTQEVLVTFTATAWDQLLKQLDRAPGLHSSFPPTWQLSHAIRSAIEGVQAPFRATVTITNFT